MTKHQQKQILAVARHQTEHRSIRHASCGLRSSSVMRPSSWTAGSGHRSRAVARATRCLVTGIVILALSSAVRGQPYGEPDRGEPGDEMIQDYLARQAALLDASFLDQVSTRESWEKLRTEYERQYLYMLGLWPLPEKTPLQATVTGKLEGSGFTVEMLHYQSRPGLYVTGNLYRPSAPAANAKLPAVLYVCGHSSRGRNGNKTAYQSHGIWFARHGYVCLVLDSLQLGEIASVHHGTYRENRWWWLARGYTPAGVECWNGIRGIDYLVSQGDVDPERIAVTGISGGGAATFWIAAADPQAGVAVPVSGMADLTSYVGNRVINGHCDCMFLHNAYRWPWTRIAALIAPRPVLFVNSDQDPIFPMDANGRITNRLEKMYSLFGAGDLVDSVVSIGGHAYRQDIRQAAYRFINTHFRTTLAPLPTRKWILCRIRTRHSTRSNRNDCAVFPTDADIPSDAKNVTIDQSFVPLAAKVAPTAETFEPWKQSRIDRLREVTFGYFPGRIPPAVVAANDSLPNTPDRTGERITTEAGITAALTCIGPAVADVRRILLFVDTGQDPSASELFMRQQRKDGDAVYIIQPRGIGPTRWTRKNPPNYVQRAHVLLGRTVETGQVWDIIAAARLLRSRYADLGPLHVAGQESAAVLAAYAALLESDIDGVILARPPATHQHPQAPALLNVLRVCDIPDILAMLAPRPLALLGCPPDAVTQVQAGYRALQAEDKLMLEKTLP